MAKSGVQFSGKIDAGKSRTWYTHGWPPTWHVAWTVVPTTLGTSDKAQVDWSLGVQRASQAGLTYWITVKNASSAEVTVEARYDVLAEA